MINRLRVALGPVIYAGALFVVASFTVFFAYSSTASAVNPSWWSGDCNVNNHAGSVPLGALLNNVKACGPINRAKLVSFGVGSGQYEWQCVELAMRYMYLVYGITPYLLTGNAKTIVSDYSGTRLEKKLNNGNELPAPGDIIAMGAVPGFEAGHTAVVTAINVNSSGNGNIAIMEQNSGWSSAGSRNLSVTSKVINSGAGEGGVTGWLHDPNNTILNERFGVLGQDGVFKAKVGINDTWLGQENNVTSAVMAGNRIGVVRTDGVLYAKEGDLYANWSSGLEANVVAAYMSGYRIGALLSNGDFKVKEGGLSSSWTLIAQNTVNAALSDNRIAVVGSDGLLRVKEGGLSSSWTNQEGSVVATSVSQNRIGALKSNSDFKVKEGNLYQNWTTVENSVTLGTVTGTRIGVLKIDGSVRVKEGGLSASWTNQEGNVASFSLSDSHVGVVFNSGGYSLKLGGLNNSWTGMYTGASKGYYVTFYN